MTIVVDNPKLEQDIPIERIHPDPFQPRLEPDAELADSIKSQGVLQAISIEVIDAGNAADRVCPDCGKLFVDLQAEGGNFMLQDGERRYRGSIDAGRKTILAKIVPAVTETERLVRQLTANTGKPLTAIEEAFAIERLAESAGELSDMEIAKMLGIPRATVGDRRRMLHLAPCWIELLKAGKLQASHTPILHTYLAVPEKYQIEAATRFASDPRAAGYLRIGEAVPIQEFKNLAWEFFDKHLRGLGKDSYPGWPENAEKYVGPTVELSRFGGSKQRYAADPDIWRPILRRAAAARASKTREKAKRSGGREKVPAHLQLPEGAKTLKSTSSYSDDLPKGFVEVVTPSGNWNVDGHRARRSGAFDVEVFLQHVDPEKLAIHTQPYNQPSVITNDTAAMGLARSAWIDRWTNRHTELMKDLREKLRKVVSVSDPDRSDSNWRVDGRGVLFLISKLAFMTDASRDLLELAEALDIAGAAEVKEKDAGKWLSKLSLSPARAVATAFAWATDKEVQPVWRVLEKEAEKVIGGFKQQAVKWDAISKRAEKPTEKEVPVAKAKDVDVGAMRAAVEAGVEEGEFAEANA